MVWSKNGLWFGRAVRMSKILGLDADFLCEYIALLSAFHTAPSISLCVCKALGRFDIITNCILAKHSPNTQIWDPLRLLPKITLHFSKANWWKKMKTNVFQRVLKWNVICHDHGLIQNLEKNQQKGTKIYDPTTIRTSVFINVLLKLAWSLYQKDLNLWYWYWCWLC